MTTKRRKRHSPEQIVRKLRDADAMLNAGKDLAAEWSKRSLADKHYVDLWVDGVHFNIRNIRLEEDRQCILVVMGATADGKK